MTPGESEDNPTPRTFTPPREGLVIRSHSVPPDPSDVRLTTQTYAVCSGIRTFSKDFPNKTHSVYQH
jgi:hypothetical protein